MGHVELAKRVGVLRFLVLARRGTGAVSGVHPLFSAHPLSTRHPLSSTCVSSAWSGAGAWVMSGRGGAEVWVSGGGTTGLESAGCSESVGGPAVLTSKIIEDFQDILFVSRRFKTSQSS
jgi:hypothetical protein